MNHSPPDDAGTEPARAITLTVLAISSLTIMANTTIAPSLPGLAETFAHVPRIETLLGLLLSLPSLAIVLTATAFGVLAERVGRRPVLLVSLVLYALGGASGLVVEGMTGLLVGRVVLGLGVAGTMTIATMLAADHWSGGARMRFMGRQAAVMSLGGVVFLIAGGALAELSWRAAFGLYLLALPVALLALSTLADDRATTAASSGPRAPLDWRFTLTVGALGFFTMAMFYLLPTRLPFLLTEMGIASPTIAGIAIAAVTLAGAITSVNVQRLRARLSPVGIYALGFALMGAGFIVIATAGALVQVLVGGAAVGLGLGAIMPTQSIWLMGAVEPAARGRAAGVLTAFVFAGQFAGPLFAGAVGLALPLRDIFLLFAALLVVMAVAMAFAASRKARAGAIS